MLGCVGKTKLTTTIFISGCSSVIWQSTEAQKFESKGGREGRGWGIGL